jgi:type IV secretion system protein VirB10
MTDSQNSLQPNRDQPEGSEEYGRGDRLRPLPGEPGIPDVAQRRGLSFSKKALAVVLVMVTVLVFTTFSLLRLRGHDEAPDDARSKRPHQRPAAAATESKRLELPALHPATAASTPPGVIIPALEPTTEELAAPIPVRGTRSGAPAPMPPEDAHVLLLSSRPGALAGAPANGMSPDAIPPSASRTAARNLQEYQRQAQGMLDSLLKRTDGTTGLPGAMPSPAAGLAAAPLPSSSTSSLLGGELPSSATPRTMASHLHPRSLTLPKGTTFTCALKTRIVSATSGFVGCQVQRNVYSEDGRVLLVERGSHLDGEYRATSVKPGSVRVPVLWTRLRTPHGVTVDLDSPGTGPLGESGVDAKVDNRWGERIGAALLLSLIDDAVKVMVTSQAQQGGTVVFSSTTNAGGDLAEKVLDSTLHIPPLLYQHQGAIVGIYVARDVDFSTVYELQPSDRGPR